MKYYAIKVGKNAPCIVETWDECLALTQGYSGAVFKRFNNILMAQDFLRARLPKWATKPKPKKKFHGKREKGALYGITQKTVRETARADTSEPLYSGDAPPWE